MVITSIIKILLNKFIMFIESYIPVICVSEPGHLPTLSSTHPKPPIKVGDMYLAILHNDKVSWVDNGQTCVDHIEWCSIYDSNNTKIGDYLSKYFMSLSKRRHINLQKILDEI